MSANREDQAGSKYDQNDDQPQRRNAEQRDGYRDRTTIARYRTDQHQSETREHAQKATENQFGGGQHGPWPFQLGGRGQHSGNGGQLGESTTFRLVAPVANKIDECNDQAPEHDEKRQDKDGYKHRANLGRHLYVVSLPNGLRLERDSASLRTIIARKSSGSLLG